MIPFSILAVDYNEQKSGAEYSFMANTKKLQAVKAVNGKSQLSRKPSNQLRRGVRSYQPVASAQRVFSILKREHVFVHFIAFYKAGSGFSECLIWILWKELQHLNMLWWDSLSDRHPLNPNTYNMAFKHSLTSHGWSATINLNMHVCVCVYVNLCVYTCTMVQFKLLYTWTYSFVKDLVFWCL